MNYFRKLFDASLGPDFWKFRLGQLISVLGNQCSAIALAWWILEKTGSAKAMAAVLAPAMAVNLFLLPLFGTLGDNFSRKKLIVIADLGRFVTASGMAAMVYFNYFHLGLLAGLYITANVGTALFDAAGGGIIPQIVPKAKVQTALQQSEAIMSFGGILGGVAGGAAVSLLGIFGAFLIDAVSFLIAGISSSQIQADTVPKRKKTGSSRKSLSHWKKEFLDGFRILWRIKVLFWICMALMLVNLALSPLSVVLPLFAKLAKNMPPWYLGALESSISLGAIAGALSLNFLQARLKRRWVMVLAIETAGLGLLLLPWSPGFLLPLFMVFLAGFGITASNIQTNTQIALVVPDSHRARFNSIVYFLCVGIMPIGIAGAGALISLAGLSVTLLIMGLLIILLTPLLLFIPRLDEFLEVPARKAGGFLKKYYPGTF